MSNIRVASKRAQESEIFASPELGIPGLIGEIQQRARRLIRQLAAEAEVLRVIQEAPPLTGYRP